MTAVTTAATAIATTAELDSPDEVLVNVMLELTNDIPLNEFGMIAHAYRPDLIPHNLQSLTEDQKHHVKEAARVPLFFSDGFPATKSGGLFWDKLDHEGNSEHLLFRKYLEMSQSHGYRSIQVLARQLQTQQAAADHYYRDRWGGGDSDSDSDSDSDGDGSSNDPENIFLDVEEPPKAQQIAGPDQVENALSETVTYFRQLYVLYFWKYRAQAFDLVGQAAIRKIRQQRAILLEDGHYLKLNAMVEHVMDRMGRFTDADLDNMDPLDTVKVMKDLVQMQRVTVGLPATAPGEVHLPGQVDGDTVEEHLRAINNRNNATQHHKTTDLLNDESTTELAQELFMRMLQQKQG